MLSDYVVVIVYHAGPWWGSVMSKGCFVFAGQINNKGGPSFFVYELPKIFGPKIQHDLKVETFPVLRKVQAAPQKLVDGKFSFNRICN